MRLEIHKAGTTVEDIHIEMTEVFPDKYPESNLVEACETEARALYDALKAGLHPEAKAYLLRLIERGGLG
jgi:hypothetical protein